MLMRVGLARFAFKAECFPEGDGLPSLLDDLVVGIRPFVLYQKGYVIFRRFEIRNAVGREQLSTDPDVGYMFGLNYTDTTRV